MRLVGLKVANLRCYRDEVSVRIGSLTAMVGQNDAGKSTLLEGLAVFFGEQKLDKGDVNVAAAESGDPVRITAIFADHPLKLVLDDARATSLETEHLLNPDGQVEIVKEFVGEKLTEKVFLKANHPSAEGVADLLRLKIAELKKRMGTLSVPEEGVNKAVCSEIRHAIWKHCADLKLAPRLISLDAEDGKDIWAQLERLLPTFALFKADRPSTDKDEEAQDPMKAAVKESVKALEAELDRIVSIVEARAIEVADRTVEKLREVHPGLAEKIEPRFERPKWADVFKISLDTENSIPVNKRGSGVRRLILLSFFRAAADKKRTEQQRTAVIYAIEEPETSQHPDSQRMLLKAFRELTEDNLCQVLLTTHTPMLAGSLRSDELRFVTVRDGVRAVLDGANEAETLPSIRQALGVLPDNPVKLFIRVEGTNDVAFLKRISRVLVEAGDDVPNLNELDRDGHVIFSILGGSNLIHAKNAMAGLCRREFHLYDGDKPEYAAVAAEVGKRDGCKATITNRRELENYLCADAIEEALGVRVVVAERNDVPSLVAEQLGLKNGAKSWTSMDVKEQKEKANTAKKRLNTEAAEKMTRERLVKRGVYAEIKGWFDVMSEMIAEHDKSGPLRAVPLKASR